MKRDDATPEPTGRPLGHMTDLEIVLEVDEPSSESNGAGFRALVVKACAARGIDVPAVRKRIAAAAARLRDLPDWDVQVVACIDSAARASGLWRLAIRECARRENERGSLMETTPENEPRDP